MTFKTLTGRLKSIPVKPYLVCWDCDQGSKFAAEILDFLYRYWRHDVVVAELPVAGTKMSYDYVNLSKKIVVECDGQQHDSYVPGHFHNTRADYLAQIKRDLAKDKAAELNDFKMVRIKPRDLPLTLTWFKEFYNLDL